MAALSSLPHAPALPARGRLPRARRGTSTVSAAKRTKEESEVTYGSGWFDATRKFGKMPKTGRTEKEALAEYKEANRRANNGKERKDLYTDNWDGSEYKGSQFNILNLLVVLFIGVPVLGLVFAYQTYGTLWG